jgi:hypothetical protein
MEDNRTTINWPSFSSGVSELKTLSTQASAGRRLLCCAFPEKKQSINRKKGRILLFINRLSNIQRIFTGSIKIRRFVRPDPFIA